MKFHRNSALNPFLSRDKIATAAFVCFVASSIHAQVLYGTLTGNVTDSTGAVIPNAAVHAVNTNTGFTRDSVSNSDGIYSFSDLQPGNYRVTVTAAGFGTFSQNNTTVLANSAARVNVALVTGSVSTTVDVSAAPPMLETDRAETNYNITTQQLTELPVTSTTGRNFQSLYKLIPGSTPPVESNSAASNPQRAQAVNVNGVSSTANATRIDGAVDQYPYLPVNVAYVPPQDAIETVNVVTGSFNAEQGSAGGAATNVIIKSGTNHFHGSAFEYNSISQFNARNYFQPASVLAVLPKNIFNQYGGSVGGPIRKDKLFFFADWESTHIRKTNSGFASVPTALERTGDFSHALNSNGTLQTLYNPATGTATGTGRTPFAGNKIPVSFAAATMLALEPLPNLPGEANNYFGSSVYGFNRNDFDFKITYNPTSATSLFGHYSFSPDTISDPQQLGAAGGGTWDGGQPGLATGLLQNLGLGATHVFTPHLLLDANAGYTRQRIGAQSADLALGDFGTQVLKIPGTNNNGQTLYGGIPYFSINGYNGLGNTNSGSPFLFRDNQYTGNVNLSYTRSVHAFRVGGEYVHAAINHFQPSGIPRGQFTFNGGLTALNGGPQSPNNYNGLADFELGIAQSIQKGVQFTNPLTLRYSQFAFYAQDTWQASKALTVNYGVRYEFYPLPVEAHTGLFNYNPAVRSTITDALGTHTVGTVIVGGVGGNSQSAGIQDGHGLVVPRLGVSYRINDKTVVRSGFGITVDPDNLRNALNSYPANINLVQNGANNYLEGGDFVTGIPALPVPVISAQGTVPLPENLSTNALPQNFRRGYIESFNLSFQRELPASFVANVAYAGSHAIRQQSNVNINAAPPGGGATGRLLNATYGANTNNSDLNESLPFRGSVYNGLQAQLSRTSSRYVSTGVIYTYSKAMDISDNSTNSGLVFAYPTVWNRDWAAAGYDRPNNLQWWTIAPFPFGKNQAFLKENFLGKFLGGWQVQTVMSKVSGTPINVTADGTALNAPGNTQVADQLVSRVQIYGAHNRAGANGAITYFNTAQFAQPTGVRFGTAGRNSLRGPGYFNLDVGVKRTLNIYENLKLQLQAESFDATNTPQFANPAVAVNTPASFGTITASNTSRSLRLSGRIIF
ncbi:MAG: carboxypeptidase regulatory-like domain-containing protein [Janthinobacterium lividum]